MSIGSPVGLQDLPPDMATVLLQRMIDQNRPHWAHDMNSLRLVSKGCHTLVKSGFCEHMKIKRLRCVDGRLYYSANSVAPDIALDVSLHAKDVIDMTFHAVHDRSAAGEVMRKIEVINASDCTGLKRVMLHGLSRLRTLDLSNCTAVQEICIHDCSLLEQIVATGVHGLLDLYNATQITTIDVGQFMWARMGGVSLEHIGPPTSSLLPPQPLPSAIIESLYLRKMPLLERVDLRSYSNMRIVCFEDCDSIQDLRLWILNKLTHVTLRRCATLNLLSLHGCHSLHTLELDACDALSIIDVAGCPESAQDTARAYARAHGQCVTLMDIPT